MLTYFIDIFYWRTDAIRLIRYFEYEKGWVEYIVLNPTYVFHIEVVEIDSIWENANLGHILLLDLRGFFDPICEIVNLDHISLLDLHGFFDPICEIVNLGPISLPDLHKYYDPICKIANLGHIRCKKKRKNVTQISLFAYCITFPLPTLLI